jgi:hypothetical protein
MVNPNKYNTAERTKLLRYAQLAVRCLKGETNDVIINEMSAIRDDLKMADEAILTSVEKMTMDEYCC